MEEKMQQDAAALRFKSSVTLPGVDDEQNKKDTSESLQKKCSELRRTVSLKKPLDQEHLMNLHLKRMKMKSRQW